MSIRKASLYALFIVSFHIVAVRSKPLLEKTPSLQPVKDRLRERRDVAANTERQWGGSYGAFGGGRPTSYGRYPPNRPGYGAWGSAFGSSYPSGRYPSYGGDYPAGYGSTYDGDYGGYGGYPGNPNYGNYGSYGGNFGGYRPYGGYANAYPPNHGYYDGYNRQQ
uniref:Uncharacterized protein n=1 Tax=Plectus sambesii TaxID=2011161 RepID=A0A914WIP6_9BILA